MEKESRNTGMSTNFNNRHRGGCDVKREKHKIKVGMMTGVMLVLISFFLQSCVMGEFGGGIGGRASQCRES